MSSLALQCIRFVLGPIMVLSFAYIYISSPVFSGYTKHDFRAYSPAPVFIRRDSLSIPTIKGNTLKDTLFGQGYAHCQDRMWSMHLSRLIAEGKVSETFGSLHANLDRSMMEIGITTTVSKIEESLSPATRTFLQAYTDGVNLCRSNYKAQPLEQMLARAGPVSDWKVSDSLAILELLKLAFTDDNPFNKGKAKGSLVTRVVESAISNKPIVVADLQMGDEGLLPRWYANNLVTQTTDKSRNITISGASIPGIPGVLTGMTDYLAWGIQVDSDKAAVGSEEFASRLLSGLFDGIFQTQKIETIDEFLQSMEGTSPFSFVFATDTANLSDRTIDNEQQKAAESSPNPRTSSGIKEIIETREAKEVNDTTYLTRLQVLTKQIKKQFPQQRYNADAAATGSRYQAIYSLGEREEDSFHRIDLGISESVLSPHFNDQQQSQSLYKINRDLEKLRENNVDALILIYDPSISGEDESTSQQQPLSQQKTEHSQVVEL